MAAQREHNAPLRSLGLVGLGLVLVTGVPSVESAATDSGWPRWRGPLGTGEAPNARPPLQWSESSNVRWKVALPGSGHSTPVVWGDRVFVTVAVPFGEAVAPRTSGEPGSHDEVPVTRHHRFMALALSRRDGSILWQRTLREALPHAGGHVTASLASASPVTDGERVVVSFGSFGVYGLTVEGEPIWSIDLGRIHALHGHGEGSSPTLSGDTLVLLWDHEGDSFLAAYNKRTGRGLWQTKRPAGSPWTTPIVVGQGDQRQVIVSGARYLRGYDLATGEPRWQCGGMSVENVVATPVAGSGLVFAGSSYDQRSLMAVRFEGAEGDITGTDHVVWIREREAPYVPSPLYTNGRLYVLRHFQGILSCLDAKTGVPVCPPLRLPRLHNVFASPVAGGGHIYIPSREGATIVLEAGDPPRPVSLNRLDDRFSASPAIAGNEIYLRGERFLYCLAKPSSP